MDEQWSELPANEGDTALYELFTRLLAPPDIYEQVVGPPRIHTGRLPENLPVRLPISDGAAVIGSVVRDLPGGRRDIEIVLDSASPAEQFREDYRWLLLASGWNEDEEEPGRSGFVPRNLPMFFRAAYRFPRLRRKLGLDRKKLPPLFRFGARGPRLAVMVQDRRNAPTDVRLQLLLGQRDPRTEHAPAWTVIPSLFSPPDPQGRLETHHTNVLSPPPEAYRTGGGGRWRPDGAYSYAVVETDLDLATVAAHYTVQLEGSGGSRTDEGLCGPQDWSYWSFADAENRPWTGAFTALRLPGLEGRYLLQVHARRLPD